MFININEHQHAMIENKTSATHYSDNTQTTYYKSVVALQCNLTQTNSINPIQDTTQNQQFRQHTQLCCIRLSDVTFVLETLTH
jgi:hypothetical protein